MIIHNVLCNTRLSVLPQVIPAHDGSVLCCSLSPCGTMVASTGADEHIVILDVHDGRQVGLGTCMRESARLLPRCSRHMPDGTFCCEPSA